MRIGWRRSSCRGGGRGWVEFGAGRTGRLLPLAPEATAIDEKRRPSPAADNIQLERKLKLKIDMMILPLSAIAYFLASMVRLTELSGEHF